MTRNESLLCWLIVAVFGLLALVVYVAPLLDGGTL
jgi:bacteriorhodopsin